MSLTLLEVLLEQVVVGPVAQAEVLGLLGELPAEPGEVVVDVGLRVAAEPPGELVLDLWASQRGSSVTRSGSLQRSDLALLSHPSGSVYLVPLRLGMGSFM